MRPWRIIILILIALCIQVSLMPLLRIHGGQPNLIFITTIALLILGQETASLWWIALGGLILEFYSPLPVGLYSLELLALFIVFRFVFRPLLHEPSIPIAGLTFFTISLVINGFNTVITDQTYFSTIPIQAIYEAIIGVVIYRFSLSRHWKNEPVKVR